MNGLKCTAEASVHYKFLFIKGDFFTGSCKHTSSAHWSRELFTITAVFGKTVVECAKNCIAIYLAIQIYLLGYNVKDIVYIWILWLKYLNLLKEMGMLVEA